ncbi:hypothetical protein [Planomonospora parontospora]|uniref:hypothetical protein n=1 Tax=Planomonospora parontospora TaxID=58119 RepID=UPI001E386519|nr:hypothetical protein [Planomonospora parontospora]
MSEIAFHQPDGLGHRRGEHRFDRAVRTGHGTGEHAEEQQEPSDEVGTVSGRRFGGQLTQDVEMRDAVGQRLRVENRLPVIWGCGPQADRRNVRSRSAWPTVPAAVSEQSGKKRILLDPSQLS